MVSAVTAAAAALWVGGLTGCSSMGDKTDADYDAFVNEWRAIAGDSLLEHAQTTFEQYGLIK